MIAPETETEGETFLWVRASDRLQLGVAWLWKQEAARALANYTFQTETMSRPRLRAGLGVQGIGVGNPGYFATAEKNWMREGWSLNGFGGLGLRSNESHAHLLGGFKATRGDWSLGLQLDGHDAHPFTSWSFDGGSVGFYWVGLETWGVMLSLQR